MNFLDHNYKLTNYLDENFDMLNVWMELIPKQLCYMKTTSTWMKVTKTMKYLDECGA
jgi:hypothetical protein